jgi:hypothetical protein
VALFTINRFVFTLQYKSCTVVVKFLIAPHFSKTVFIVTFDTIVPESIFMHILVADTTIFWDNADPILKDNQRAGARLVAFPAINLFVFPFQGEMSFAVVKFV